MAKLRELLARITGSRTKAPAADPTPLPSAAEDVEPTPEAQPTPEDAQPIPADAEPAHAYSGRTKDEVERKYRRDKDELDDIEKGLGQPPR